MTAKRVLYVLFLVSLWVPLAAVSLSPRFPDVAKNLLNRTGNWDVEKETLRRTTPLWNGAVAVYNTLAYRMGASNNRAIAVVGQDGWVFLGDVFQRSFSQAVGRRRLNESDLNQWASSWRGQADFLRSRGIGFIVVVAPSQGSIYRDKLPTWAPSGEGKTPLDQLLALKPALPMLDMRPGLKAARTTEDTYSKLNSHWTDYGAFVAWPTLADEIERQTGEHLWRPKLAKVVITDEANEFDGMMSIRARNRWTGYQLTQVPGPFEMIAANGHRQPVEWNMKTSLFDMPRRTWDTSAPSSKRLLVMRDSMGDAISPFLQRSFRDVIQIRHSLDTVETRPDFIATVEQAKPDMVVVLLTERYLDAAPPPGMYWHLARAYFNPAARELGSWKRGDDAQVMDAQGDASLRTSGFSIDLEKSPRKRTYSAIVRVDVNAVGAGRLRFQVQCPTGAPRYQTIQYRDGRNVLLFELEAKDCGRLAIARETGAAEASINALAIKQL